MFGSHHLAEDLVELVVQQLHRALVAHLEAGPHLQGQAAERQAPLWAVPAALLLPPLLLLLRLRRRLALLEPLAAEVEEWLSVASAVVRV